MAMTMRDSLSPNPMHDLMQADAHRVETVLVPDAPDAAPDCIAKLMQPGAASGAVHGYAGSMRPMQKADASQSWDGQVVK